MILLDQVPSHSIATSVSHIYHPLLWPQTTNHPDLPESGISTAVISIHDDNGDITDVEAAFSCRSNRLIPDTIGYLAPLDISTAKPDCNLLLDRY